MRKLNFDYLVSQEKPVPDKEDLFKSGIPAASKLRSMITTIQRLFKTPGRNVNLSVVGDNWFKIYVHGGSTGSPLVSVLYYNPDRARLDLYDAGDLQTPMLVWDNKQCVLKNIGATLETLKIETLFLPIISYL